MKVVIDLSDKYVYKWFDFMHKIGIEQFDAFLLQAIGIGVQTMVAAYKIKNGFGDSNSNVIEFDKNSYWEN